MIVIIQYKIPLCYIVEFVLVKVGSFCAQLKIEDI